MLSPVPDPLVAASAAGIPTTNLTRRTLLAGRDKSDRAVLEDRLGTLIGGNPTWSRFAAGSQPAVSSLAPVALVRLHDGVLPDANLFFPLMLGADEQAAVVLRESLIVPCLERLGALGDLDVASDLEIVIRPSLSVWLQLGAILHFAKFKPGRLLRLSEVRATASGGLSYRMTTSSAAYDLSQRLASLWSCNFDAVLMERDGIVELVDTSIDEEGEQENSRHLAQLLGAADLQPNKVGALIANATARVPAEHAPTRAPIYRGQAHGHRCASGPVAFTLAEAARFAAGGERPILVVENLLPAAASGLEHCAGVVLGRDGPASHIAILARGLGLAVVTGVEGLQYDNVSTPLGSDALRSGDLVSVREEDGGIYHGAIQPSASPVTAIADWLDRVGDNRIAIAVGNSIAGLPSRPVGLCRSEMHLLGSAVAPVFQGFLARAAVSKRLEPIPEEVQSRLRRSLAELLSVTRGELTNYRLVDADLGEVLNSRSGSVPSVYATIRGPRWAIASGFYDWQVRMAISTAAAASRDGPVNLIITLPSAFGLAEVRAVRAIFNQCLLEYPEARSSVRFGVMIETPRLCATPSLLATSADAFCFGLNDLTSAVFGLGRQAWPELGSYYAAAGMEAQDPFANLDLIGVGPLVARTIRALRIVGAKGPMLLCGEPAASEAAHAHFAREQSLYFSVEETDWARATLSCARQRARLSGAVRFRHSAAYDETTLALGQVVAARAIGRNALAQDVALRWFMSVCPPRPFPISRNWKVLKKLLVMCLFGELEGRFFPSPWRTEEIASYIRSLDYPGRATRTSAFPNNISCHARSEIVSSDWSESELLRFLQTFDPDTTLHVFPQQHPEQMCFRVVYTETGLIVEAGWGQAMYVFEAERGQHPIISCQAPLADGLAAPEIGVPVRLSSAFGHFLGSRRGWLQAMHDVLPRLLGSKQLAIEGYFDANTGRDVIVDIDVPLDLAWNTPKD